MEQSPTVQELIDMVKRERASWEALIEKIEQERFTQPGVADQWSVKDIIAHITWHEREMVSLVEAHALVGSELWNLPTDDRNAVIYEEIRQQPLEQVLEEMRGEPPVNVDFAEAAARVLERRVRNAPPGRREQRWLPGWLRRVDSYRRD